MPDASPGQPAFLPLITINRDETVLSKRIIFHKKTIKSILLNEKFANKKVAILSITGAAYSGKSYLLNMMMEYLKSCNVESISKLTTLDGFDWGRHPIKRTNGINIFNRAVEVRLPSSNEQVAVLFLDSQGLYDSLKQSSMEDDTVLFTLLQLFSSHLFFNVSRQLNELDLSYLTLLCDFANRTQAEIDEAYNYKECLFQQVSVIVRDWSFLDQHPIGHKGGQDYIDEFLSIDPMMPTDHQMKRKLFKSQYDKIDGFLFPYPGKEVARKNEFVGQWSALDEDFQEAFKNFFNTVLNPDNLQLKKIFGNYITCSQLMSYTEDYYQAAVSSDRPTILDAIDANSHNNQIQLQETCLGFYDDLMKHRFNHIKSADSYFNYHLHCRKEALQMFIDTPKYGSQKLTQQSIDNLTKEINMTFQNIYYFVPIQTVNPRQILKVIGFFIFIILTLLIIKKIFVIFKYQTFVLIFDLFSLLTIAILFIYISNKLSQWRNPSNSINETIQTLITTQLV